MKKKYILWFIFISMVLASNLAMAFKCSPEWTMGHYLLRRDLIYAEVKEVSKTFLRVKIIEPLKAFESSKKNLKLWHYIGRSEYSEVKNLKLFEEGEKYIFIVSQFRNFPEKYVYTEVCNRFKVHSDSLYIGSPYIKSLEELDSSLIYQKNTFQDTLMPFGYKISLPDFKNLIDQVNKSFSPSPISGDSQLNYYYRRNHKLKSPVRSYVYSAPTTGDKLTLAIIGELKKIWGL